MTLSTQQEVGTFVRLKIKRSKRGGISSLDPFKPVFSFIAIKFELVSFGVKKIDTFSDEVVNSGGNFHVVGFQLSVAFLKRGKVFDLQGNMMQTDLPVGNGISVRGDCQHCKIMMLFTQSEEYTQQDVSAVSLR